MGDAVERLQDEQRHILELFETHARHQRDAHRPGVREVERLSTLIYTLLRVHCELQAMLMASPLKDAEGFGSAAAAVNARREAMLEALERMEALSPRDAEHPQEMKGLAHRVRLWFQACERHLFPLARDRHADLARLDDEMAARQESLLSAGQAVALPGATTAR